MRTVVLFNRDLRLADHSALHAAAGASGVLPLFVFCPRMLARVGPHRRRYLRESLIDLDATLRRSGTQLWCAVGDPATECLRIASATNCVAIHVTADYSQLARRREEALETGSSAIGATLQRFHGIAGVEPGVVRPAAGRAFQVFTPYLRRWLEVPLSAPLPKPRTLAAIPDVPALDLHEALARVGLTAQVDGSVTPAGGETAARQRLRNWLRSGLDDYAASRDLLALAATSQLSADLHFGCLSAMELRWRARAQPAASDWIRQLCWRDFYLQALAEFPQLAREPFQPRARVAYASQPRSDGTDSRQYLAWCAGRTGTPIVDAGMRQLHAEGFMHNRARMITATWLTRQCGIDWRLGLAHFDYWLADGDLAQNSGNWQWIAGTGHDRRPNRAFNLRRQAFRFDPLGDYVRRYVPELRAIPGAAVHAPWLCGLQLDYPARVD